MKVRSPIVLALAFAMLLATALGAHAQELPRQQSPRIRVGVDRVNVGVIVTDSQGRFVEGLRREDFRIFDNGAEQPISGFLPIQEPAQVVLLIESGPAVLFLGKTDILAADKLLDSLSIEDRVALVTYSRSPRLLIDFSIDKSLVRMALGSVNFTNGFADLNLTTSLGNVIDWLAPLPGKKSIVLLCSGVDTSSASDWQGVRDKLNTSDVRILAVSLSGNLRKPAKAHKLTPQEKEARAFLQKGFAQADESLRQVSAATGGRAYFPGSNQEFEQTYAQIAELLRHEYSLAFAPSALDGRIHSIDVKTKNSGFQVGHRQAYLASQVPGAN
jgi:Ca-activated chloride channel homolog